MTDLDDATPTGHPVELTRPQSAPPLAYYPDAAERAFAAQVVGRLAWIGIVLGSFGLLGTLAVAMLRSGVFSGMSITFPGGLQEWVGQGGQVLAFAILSASAPLALKLRPNGRRGMLLYAVVAIGASALSSGVAAFGVMTDQYPGMNAADRAYLLLSNLLYTAWNVAYPVVVLTVFRVGWIRDAFKP